jgi:hypothetical protein
MKVRKLRTEKVLLHLAQDATTIQPYDNQPNDTQHNGIQNQDSQHKQRVLLCCASHFKIVILLDVIKLAAIMLSTIMLSVIMLRVIMLSVIMVSYSLQPCL